MHQDRSALRDPSMPRKCGVTVWTRVAGSTFARSGSITSQPCLIFRNSRNTNSGYRALMLQRSLRFHRQSCAACYQDVRARTPRRAHFHFAKKHNHQLETPSNTHGPAMVPTIQSLQLTVGSLSSHATTALQWRTLKIHKRSPIWFITHNPFPEDYPAVQPFSLLP